ncbi:MAG TPA: PSD1 and planctomycete cytochrome C domain-containing protein [Pirellulales bacterium]|nr:PSD1 and planctomycete cytochrome C domain-containing protein [Pirellulales bacterium]
MNRGTYPILILAALALAISGPAQADDTPSFERGARAVFKEYCFDCHGGGEKVEGNLDLRLRRFIVRGGDSGPAIAPGNAADSLLLARVKAGEMPPGQKKVPPERLAVLERWIAAGAPILRDEPEALPPGIDITPDERAFWLFQPIRRSEPPTLPGVVHDEVMLAQQPQADIVRTPIDAFVLAKLREKGLRFAPDADRLTLIRRASFDLTGLPPTPQEIADFVADTSDQAYDRLLDRLLSSPYYGERWGRHWLDVAGYADSEGNGSDDTPRPYAYKFRDYVIRSFNEDKPFDRFVTEQLAGDELVPQPWSNLPPEQIEVLAATGFLLTAADPTAGGGDTAEGANQMLADTLKIVGSSLLGLTVGCAQCHDHRYDPIPQSDYYRLRAVFEPTLDPAHWRRPSERRLSLYTDQDRAKAAAVEAEANTLQEVYNAKQTKFVNEALEKELEKFPEELRGKLRDAYNTPGDKRSDEQKQLLAANPKVNISPGVLYQYNQAAADELKGDQAKIAAKRAEKPVEDFVSVANELQGTLPATHVFYRGDYRQPKQEVLPGDLTIAAADGQRLEIAGDDPRLPTSGRRLALARHLMSGKHPLTGRVLANRIWLNHFGRGLVDTAGDFGMLGTRPTHPELLDWLADEFARQGWSMKRMHKLIMLSTIFRQSSVARPLASGAIDPRALDGDNSYYWHYPVRRLEAEILRDRILTASGQLNRAQFGPAVPVVDDFVGQVVVKDELPRRSVYLEVRRSKPVSFLSTFDAPVMTLNCERRVPSTGAPQSLMLMNSEFVLKQAHLFAERVRSETPADFAPPHVQPLTTKYPRHADAWQFGWGAFDEAESRVTQFNALPHFTGSAWQGGPTLPEAGLGWVLLNAAGGHAGNDTRHAAIRRWTAPHAGFATISGVLHHPSEHGDGIRARAAGSRTGLLAEWLVKTRETATDVPRVEVHVGDTIDFVVDCFGDVNCDSFTWNTQIKLCDAENHEIDRWTSAADFHGPQGISIPQQIAYAWRIAYQREATLEELESACRFIVEQLAALRASDSKTDHELSAMTSLCQQLLSSNEFLYVD